MSQEADELHESDAQIISISTLSYDHNKQVYYEKNIPYTSENVYKNSSNVFYPKTEKTSLPVIFMVMA